MSKPATLEKFRQHLFTSTSELDLTEGQKAQLVRYRDIYTVWLEDPSLTRAQLRDYMINNYPGISQTQVYKELSDVYILLGNVQNASRNHIQYVVNETLLDVIGKLKKEPKKYKELIMAVDKLAKYNQLNQDAPEPVDWSQMVDFEIEPTSDPSVLGVKPMKNLEEIKAKLYKKYADEIIDVEHEEISPDAGNS